MTCLEILLTVLGLIIAALAAWSANSQACVARTTAMLARAQRKDALFDRRHDTVSSVADAINLVLNEKGGTTQALDGLVSRVQALFPRPCVAAFKSLQEAAKRANAPLIALNFSSRASGANAATVANWRGYLRQENDRIIAAYREFLKTTQPYMSYDEPEKAPQYKTARPISLAGEIMKVALAAFLGAGLAVCGQIWLDDLQEGKAASAAACRLLPDMKVLQDGLAAVAAEPLPELHDLPKPSALQVASRSAEGLPPGSYRMAVALRDTWGQIQNTLITATIGQDAEAKTPLV